jgi:Holliday junction resolvasome RuvABC endonuclease subunit
MVRRTLGLDDGAELGNDAADALAIALTHIFRARLGQAIQAVDNERRANRRVRA